MWRLVRSGAQTSKAPWRKFHALPTNVFAPSSSRDALDGFFRFAPIDQFLGFRFSERFLSSVFLRWRVPWAWKLVCLRSRWPFVFVPLVSLVVVVAAGSLSGTRSARPSRWSLRPSAWSTVQSRMRGDGATSALVQLTSAQTVFAYSSPHVGIGFLFAADSHRLPHSH